MKTNQFFSKSAFLLCLLTASFTLLYSCQQDAALPTQSTKVEPQELGSGNQNLEVEEAKKWFNSQANLRTKSTAKTGKQEFLWDNAFKIIKGSKGVAVPLSFEITQKPRLRGNSLLLNEPKNDQDNIENDQLATLFISKDDKGNIKSEIVSLIPENYFYDSKQRRAKKYSGLVIINDMDGNFIKGSKVKDGEIIGNIRIGGNEPSNGRVKNQYICDYVDWFSCSYVPSDPNSSVYCSFMHSEPVYCEGDNTGASLEASTFTGITSGFDGYTATATTPSISYAGQSDPDVNVDAELDCFTSGSGTYTYSLTVYVDQPYAGESTPSTWWFNVGHTFVGFSRTDVNTGQTIRRVIGFYPQDDVRILSVVAQVESTVKNNEGHEYDVSIAYTVNSTQFAAAVNRAKTWDNDLYNLEDQNCTDAVMDVTSAAGIFLPSQRQKIHIGTNFFIHSPSLMGRLLQNIQYLGQTPNNATITVNANSQAPSKTGSCN